MQGDSETKRVECARCQGNGRLRSGGHGRSGYYSCEACNGNGYREITVRKPKPAAPKAAAASAAVPAAAKAKAAAKAGPSGATGSTASSGAGAGSSVSAKNGRNSGNGSRNGSGVELEQVTLVDDGNGGSGGNGGNGTGSAAPRAKKKISLSREAPVTQSGDPESGNPEGGANSSRQGNLKLNVSVDCTYIGQVMSVALLVGGLLMVVSNKSDLSFVMGILILLVALGMGYALFKERIKERIGMG